MSSETTRSRRRRRVAAEASPSNDEPEVTTKTDPAPDEVQAAEVISEPPPAPEAEPKVKVLRALHSLRYMSSVSGEPKDAVPDDLLQDVKPKDAARFIELEGAEWAEVDPSELLPKED